jgi:hypothetical protein
MKKSAALIVAVLVLAGCGGNTTQKTAPPTTTSPSGTPTKTVAPSQSPSPTKTAAPDPLRVAVQAYSDAYLTGKPLVSYNLLSKRCQARVSLSYWTGLVTAAKDAYGSALPIKTYSEHVEGTLARVTYTYDVSAIDQTDEPWVMESGHWHEDDCG